MKGTDVTEDQLEAARKFVIARAEGSPMPDDLRLIAIPFGQLARLVAWYGALRYMAGRDGSGGSFESPGEVVVREAINA